MAPIGRSRRSASPVRSGRHHGGRAPGTAAVSTRAPRVDQAQARSAAVVEVTIEQLSPEGDGVCRVGGRSVRVPFTIPGERVRIQLGAGPHALGSVVEVMAPSPHRVAPRCRHFGPAVSHGRTCGGCSWQHIAYPEQLVLKTALLDRLVRQQLPHAPRASLMRTAHGSEPWGFRQKVHFVFAQDHGGSRDSRLLMGHFARGSHQVVNVAECPVHDNRGNRLAFAARDTLTRAGVQAADGRTSGTLRSLAIRVAKHTDELMATLVVTDEGERRLRTAMRTVMGAAPSSASFHLNIHAGDDGFIFGAHTRTLVGAARLRDTVGDSSYLMSPTAFFQTNVAAAELLVATVLECMPAAPSRVLDLYAGAGLFSIPLARAGHQVTAIESNRQAVEDGRASARLNRVPEAQCRFVVARTEDGLPASARADVAVIDPPRDGCSPAVRMRLFGEVRPARVVYVSCNPEALARDLVEIVELGYTIDSLTPIDMFPHTPHIETVVVLTR